MKLPEIAVEWIQKAQDDYGFACASLEDRKLLLKNAGFIIFSITNNKKTSNIER